MKKLLKYSIVFLIVYAPLFGMKKQPSTDVIQQECYCGIKVQRHRFHHHIYAHHVIMELGKKKYLCPKEGCQITPFSKTTEVVNHLIVNHGLSLQQPTRAKKALTDEHNELTTTTDLWSTTNNHETIESKTLCTCGKRSPKGKKARISHIKTHHHSSIHFQKTYHCTHANCYFTANTPELVVEHRSIHDTNVKPIKKIRKKGSKQQKKQRSLLILPKIDQLPCTCVTESSPVSNDHHSTDNFLNFQTEELEDLFAISFDSIIEN